MTTDLEKQFFDTFGVEPEIFTGCKLEKNNWKEDTCPFEKDGIMELCHKVCKYAFTEREIYPQITDRILLELITFLADAFVGNYCIPDVDYDNLKSNILNDCLKYSNKGYIKDQVRTLFEEG